MQLLNIALLLASCLSVVAQPALNNVYGTETGNIGGTIIPEQNGYFISGTGYSNQFNNWSAIKLYRIDSLGNVLWEKGFGKDKNGYQDGASGGNCKRTNDGGYAIPGGFWDSITSIFVGIILRVDSSGNGLWMDTFALGSFTLFNDGIVTTDNGFVTIGQTTGLGDTTGDIYLVKVESNGNFLWQKKYGGNQADDGYKIGLMPDGGFIISGSTSSFGPGTTSNYLIRTDSEGNVIWSRTYGAYAVANGACLAQPAIEGGFIMFGLWDTSVANGNGQYVAKLDTAGNIKWITFFDSSYLSIDQIRELESHEIIVASDKNKPSGSGYFDEASVIKLDSNGHQLWEKLLFYNGPDVEPSDEQYTSGNFYDFESTADGGFAFTGTTDFNDTSGAQIQEIWLVKTDSTGCLDSCGKMGIEQVNEPNAELKIYPNPAYSNVTIEWQLTAANEATILIYDMLGTIVFNQKISSGKTEINLSGLESDAYIVKLQIADTFISTKKLIIIR